MGSSSAAQALLGKTVGIAGGAMYTQYRVVDASACLVLPEGATARDGASSFVNPLTALGMLETMRREGHSGLVHTAAASNLGQMLVKLCQKDEVPLVNIVRKPDQAELLRSLGAVHVCNSSSPTFSTDLVEAIKATSATLGFDATGGGTLVSQILNGMEEAANSTAGEYYAVWVDRPQARIHLRRTRYQSDDPHQELRYRVGCWRVAAGPHPQNAGAETVGRRSRGWPRSSPRRSRVRTPGRFPLPACSGPMRSTLTSSRGDRGEASGSRKSSPNRKSEIDAVKAMSGVGVPATRPTTLTDTAGVVRCGSVTEVGTDLTEYHDEEWGTAVHGEAALFQALVLIYFENGLSWALVFNKREALGRAFVTPTPPAWRRWLIATSIS